MAIESPIALWYDICMEHIIGFGETIPTSYRGESEHIIYAAIGGVDGEFYVGQSHGLAGATCKKTWGNDYRDHIDTQKQGFITNKLRFLDRQKAFLLAKENGQISPDKCTDNELHSEELI